MGSGIFTANTTIKVSGAVNVVHTGIFDAIGVASYTVPANSYAIIHAGGTSNGGTSATLSISGLIIYSAGASTSYVLGAGSAVYVGPSLTVTMAVAGSGNNTARLSGVVFTNSP